MVDNGRWRIGSQEERAIHGPRTSTHKDICGTGTYTTTLTMSLATTTNKLSPQRQPREYESVHRERTIRERPPSTLYSKCLSRPFVRLCFTGTSKKGRWEGKMRDVSVKRYEQSGQRFIWKQGWQHGQHGILFVDKINTTLIQPVVMDTIETTSGEA